MARILFASWRVAEMARDSEYRPALTTTAHCTNEYPDDIQKAFAATACQHADA
jgi:hypothetical protein